MYVPLNRCACFFITIILLLLLHPFNGLFSRTAWVGWYQKGKTSMDFNEARDDGVLRCSGISWTICKQSTPRFRQITTSTPHHSIFTGWMLFLTSIGPHCNGFTVQHRTRPVTMITHEYNQPVSYTKQQLYTNCRSSNSVKALKALLFSILLQYWSVIIIKWCVVVVKQHQVVSVFRHSSMPRLRLMKTVWHASVLNTRQTVTAAICSSHRQEIITCIGAN